MAEETPFINERGKDVSRSVDRLIQNAVESIGPADIEPIQQIDTLHGQFDVHPQLAPFIDDSHILTRTDELRHTLAGLGTTLIALSTEEVVFDGQPVVLNFVTATGAEAAETKDNMTDAVWIRDQAFIAEALLSEDDPNLRLQGKALLQSLLHCMSTPSQIKRFDKAIRRKGDIKPKEHPAIKFDLSVTDDGQKVLDHETVWGHNQDAWQIMACIALDAYEKGQLKPEEIQNYSQFFKRIPQFLGEINYLEKDSKGSWEEISAKGRLSTVAWEWALLTRLLKHGDVFEFDDSTRSQMQHMIEEGAGAIIQRFPNESTEYHASDDPSHRQEDVALLYVGLAQVPELLTQMESFGCTPVDFMANPQVATKIAEGLSPVDAMYQVMFETVDELKDPTTGGYARYAGDSYQAGLFWTKPCWEALAGEGGLWIDDKKFQDRKGVIHFVARQKLVNALNQQVNGTDYGEHIARWMHPNTQAASIAFRRACVTTDPQMREWYKERGTRDFRDALRMITGENEHTIRPGEYGMEVVQMPPGIAPECYVSENLGDDKVINHVGPWGPLFWSAAGIRQMLTAAKQCQLQN